MSKNSMNPIELDPKSVPDISTFSELYHFISKVRNHDRMGNWEIH